MKRHRAASFCFLPALDVLKPLVVFRQMPAEDIGCIGRRFLWAVSQGHVGFFGTSPALSVVARGAGGHHIRPDM